MRKAVVAQLWHACAPRRGIDAGARMRASSRPRCRHGSRARRLIRAPPLSGEALTPNNARDRSCGWCPRRVERLERARGVGFAVAARRSPPRQQPPRTWTRRPPRKRKWTRPSARTPLRRRKIPARPGLASPRGRRGCRAARRCCPGRACRCTSPATACGGRRAWRGTRPRARRRPRSGPSRTCCTRTAASSCGARSWPRPGSACACCGRASWSGSWSAAARRARRRGTCSRTCRSRGPRQCREGGPPTVAEPGRGRRRLRPPREHARARRWS